MVRNLPANYLWGILGLDPWVGSLGKTPREGNSNPLLYSFLDNSMDRGIWWAHSISWGPKELDKTEPLSPFHFKAFIKIARECFNNTA